MKELQSLGLDVKVMDEQDNEIEMVMLMMKMQLSAK